MVSIRLRLKYFAWAGLLVLVLGGGAIAAFAVMTSPTELNGNWNKSDQDVAIGGYDTVAYFTKGRPVKGEAAISYAWRDAKWHFASQDHRDMFAADPDQYVPEFGGFCSAAMTYGAIAKANPELWAIVDGKLYLNYDEYAYKVFHENLAENIAKADQKWAEKIEEEIRTRTAQTR